MLGKPAVKLTMRTVDALSTTDRDALFWDRDLRRKVYIVQARGPAGAKPAVVGRHGEIRAGADGGGAHRSHGLDRTDSTHLPLRERNDRRDASHMCRS